MSCSNINKKNSQSSKEDIDDRKHSIHDNTQSELKKLKSEFDLYDIDKNGHLDSLEVQSIIAKATGKTPTLTEVQYCIKQVDKNNDQVLQFEEFVEMFRQVKQIDDEAWQQFSFFDKNGDGFIEYSELKKGLKLLNQKLKKSQIKKMIEEADVDKDGRVSFEEFKKMILE